MVTYTIAKVETSKDLADIKELFKSYALSLNIDLTFQDFAAELASMPGKYAEPHGVLLLARNDTGEAIGCVGVRPFDLQGRCEMKRLYVDPKGRGTGVGRALAVAVVGAARIAGYSTMRLDTLPTMTSAIGLYKQVLGFKEIDAYYSTPIEGTIFLEKGLID